MKRLMTMAAALLFAATGLAVTQNEAKFYQNPVIDKPLPDPTVVRADDGYFYLYATGHLVPIYKSLNLVDWTKVGTAFTNESRPKWNPKAGIWAPDINCVDGKYVLYYAMSTWGGEWDCGIGVATADNPAGPFTDHGAMFISKDMGTKNSIDADYVEYEGRKYLFWGSFRNIWYIELSDDGLKLKEGAKPTTVSGTFMEGTYIHKRGQYYYMFGSSGSCCAGEKSTYRMTVGRSRSPFGPYVDKQDRPLMENYHEVVLHGSNEVAGPGHNAEIFTDDEGIDWIIYHGFKRDKDKDGRVVWLDRVEWVDGWPYIANSRPSTVSERPKFGNILLADPTIYNDEGTYYLYGTGRQPGRSGQGFEVYRSNDLVTWEGPIGNDEGFCLKRSAATWGTRGFWAPQLIKHNGKYHFVYTADEHIAIATADSPLGPFRQEEPACLPADVREIDPFIFFDGKKTYIYYVRVHDGGNRIYVAEMNKDMKSMKENTARLCVEAEGGWEHTSDAKWRVCEGPSVVKIDKTYYLFYSCNDFRNKDYAVGYATSDSPTGPWKKHGEPIIVRGAIPANGTGHGDLLKSADGEWLYVFHTHFDCVNVAPRKTAIVTLDFDGKEFRLREGSFRYITFSGE